MTVYHSAGNWPEHPYTYTGSASQWYRYNGGSAAGWYPSVKMKLFGITSPRYLRGNQEDGEIYIVYFDSGPNDRTSDGYEYTYRCTVLPACSTRVVMSYHHDTFYPEVITIAYILTGWDWDEIGNAGIFSGSHWTDVVISPPLAKPAVFANDYQISTHLRVASLTVLQIYTLVIYLYTTI